MKDNYNSIFSKFSKTKAFLALYFLLMICQYSSNLASNQYEPNKETWATKKPIPANAILFFAPRHNDRYYKGYHGEILNFFKNISARAHPKDNFIFVGDEKQAVKMQQLGIPKKNIYVANSVDIWARDICPVITPHGSFNFVYRPDYHSKSDARYFERGFEKILSEGGVNSTPLPLNLDGGNFVFNGKDKAIVCEKVFDENPKLSEDEVVNILAKVAGSTKIAFLAQEDGEPLGHSDGMVSWLDTNTLLVNSYEGEMRKKVFAELKRAFPNVKLIEVPWTPGDDFRSGIADASGVYTNILHTQNALYTMSFDMPADKRAVDIIKANTNKKVIVIPAGKVSKLGGGIRCLSWQNRKLYKGQILQL